MKVTQFVLHMIEDLKLTTIQFESSCEHLGKGKGKSDYPSNYIPKLTAYCKKILSDIDLYKKQVAYYKTAYQIMRDEIDLILPISWKARKVKEVL